MAKQNQTTTVQSAPKSQQKPAPTPVSEVGNGLALTDMQRDRLELAGAPSLQGQAGRLDDPRLQTLQRQMLAGKIGQTQGNGHLQRIVAITRKAQQATPQQSAYHFNIHRAPQTPESTKPKAQQASSREDIERAVKNGLEMAVVEGYFDPKAELREHWSKAQQGYFKGKAEQFALEHNAVGLVNGQLVVGSKAVLSAITVQDVIGYVRNTLSALQKLLQRKILVSTLAVFTHGLPDYLNFGAGNLIAIDEKTAKSKKSRKNNIVETGETAQGFAKEVDTALSDTARVVMYACLTGSTYEDEVFKKATAHQKGKKDAGYESSRTAVTTDFTSGGEGSFADALRDALNQANKKREVWGHRTTADTTKNPHWRVFEDKQVQGEPASASLFGQTDAFNKHDADRVRKNLVKATAELLPKDRQPTKQGQGAKGTFFIWMTREMPFVPDAMRPFVTLQEKTVKGQKSKPSFEIREGLAKWFADRYLDQHPALPPVHKKSSNQPKKQAGVQRQSILSSHSIVQFSPFSDRLSQIWNSNNKSEFFNQLRAKGATQDSDALLFIQQILKGDDKWLAECLIKYGPEPHWPLEEINKRNKWKNEPGNIERTFNIGNGKQPIRAYYFPGTSSKRALIIGGVHGTEAAGVEVVNILLARMRVPNSPMPYYSVIVVPVLFPENLAHHRRKTPGKKSVDPNRQMPAIGSSPGKFDSTGKRPIEPENLVLLDLIERFQPERIASVHGIAKPDSMQPEKGEPGITADPRLGLEQKDDELAIKMARSSAKKGARVPGNYLGTSKETSRYPTSTAPHDKEFRLVSTAHIKLVHGQQ